MLIRRDHVSLLRMLSLLLIAALSLACSGESESNNNRKPSDNERAASIPSEAIRHDAQSLLFSPHSEAIAAIRADGDVLAWPLRGILPEQRDANLSLSTAYVLEHPDGEVISMAWSRDGALLATGSSSGSLRLWSPFEKRIIRKWKADAKDAEITAITFHPDGEQILVAERIKHYYTMRLLALQNLEITKTYPSFVSESSGLSLHLSEDAQTITVCHQALGEPIPPSLGIDFSRFQAHSEARLAGMILGGSTPLPASWQPTQALYPLPPSHGSPSFARFASGKLSYHFSSAESAGTPLSAREDMPDLIAPAQGKIAALYLAPSDTGDDDQAGSAKSGDHSVYAWSGLSKLKQDDGALELSSTSFSAIPAGPVRAIALAPTRSVIAWADGDGAVWLSFMHPSEE